MTWHGSFVSADAPSEIGDPAAYFRREFEASWHIGDGEIALDVTVPVGTTATVVLPRHHDEAIEEVGAGAHSWRYPQRVGYGVAGPVSMDTPIGQLRKDPAIWAAVTEALTTYLPGVPLDAGGDRVATMSLQAVVQSAPGAAGALETDLRKALTTSHG